MNLESSGEKNIVRFDRLNLKSNYTYTTLVIETPDLIKTEVKNSEYPDIDGAWGTIQHSIDVGQIANLANLPSCPTVVHHHIVIIILMCIIFLLS